MKFDGFTIIIFGMEIGVFLGIMLCLWSLHRSHKKEDEEKHERQNR